MYVDQEWVEAIRKIRAIDIGIDCETYEECIEYVSSIVQAIQASFAPMEAALREAMQQIADAAETLAEIVTQKIRHTVIYSCKLPGQIRSHLIPWYTSGFQ